MIRPLEHLTLGISVLLKTPFETPKCYTFRTSNLQNLGPSDFWTVTKLFTDCYLV